MEESNRHLKRSLLAAEQAKARVAELSALLQNAEAELERLKNDAVTSTASPKDNAAVVSGSQKELVEGRALPPLPRASRKSALVAKRGKVRRDNQIDLFDGQFETGQTSANTDTNPSTIASAGDSGLPALDPAPASAASATQDSEQVMHDFVGDLEPVLKRKNKPASPRQLPAQPSVNLAQLRKAANQILPLLADQDPGASDCLKANRATFRSAFTAEAYEEFEQLIKKGHLGTALEQLKKAAKRHGMSL
jgi:hypothetical protein